MAAHEYEHLSYETIILHLIELNFDVNTNLNSSVSKKFYFFFTFYYPTPP